MNKNINDISKMMYEIFMDNTYLDVSSTIETLEYLYNKNEKHKDALINKEKNIKKEQSIINGFIPFLITCAVMVLLFLIFRAVGILFTEFLFSISMLEASIVLINIFALSVMIKEEINDSKFIDANNTDIILFNLIEYALYKQSSLTPLHQVENKGGCNEGN